MFQKLLVAVLFSLSSVPGWAADLRPSPAAPSAVTVEVSDTRDLVKEGWEQVAGEVWQTTLDSGADAELAVGAAAFERAVKWLDEEIRELQKLAEPTEEQELRLFESVVRREQLSKWLEQQSSPDKLVDTSSQRVCFGSASFTHTYGFSGFVTPKVISDSLYTEFGPLSSGTKTAYARARVCGDGTFCTQNTDTNSVGSSFAVGATATAATSPFFGCTADAFGYVLVLQASGCTDIVSLSTNHTCAEFYNDQI